MNVVSVVGEIIELPIMRESSAGNKVATLAMKVVRPFKNSEGYYDFDEFNVTLWRGIAETTCEVCKVGDVIAVKGRLQSRLYEKEDVIYRNCEIVAEHLSFIQKQL